MRKVQIITDSAVDLPEELIEKHNIDVVPFYIYFGEESYRDGDITPKKMYKRVEELGELPKTAAVSPAEWMNHYDEYINQEMDIFVLTLGSKISSNFQNAYLASQEYEENRVVVCDSRVLSGSIGLLALKAAKFRDQGLSAKEIKVEIEKLIPKMHTQFVIKTLDYLHKGGRCNALTKFIGTVLSIKPQIKMIDGKLDIYKRNIGKMSRAIDVMLDDFFKIESEGKLDNEFVFITHSIAPRMTKHILDEIKKRNIDIENLIISNAGTVISSHCGEGTIGILYLEK